MTRQALARIRDLHHTHPHVECKKKKRDRVLVERWQEPRHISVMTFVFFGSSGDEVKGEEIPKSNSRGRLRRACALHVAGGKRR
jgi:hypothetical protein